MIIPKKDLGFTNGLPCNDGLPITNGLPNSFTIHDG